MAHYRGLGWWEARSGLNPPLGLFGLAMGPRSAEAATAAAIAVAAAAAAATAATAAATATASDNVKCTQSWGNLVT